MAATFYWHDYETTGVNPATARPCQFAGQRTDENLQLIDEPLVLYCCPEDDILPYPRACMVTGITPQHALEKGLPEPAFIRQIHTEMSAPETCGVGYNSIRFDDEITRYALYRNFYDPYQREWQHGNSRWDIIDMLRLMRALRPDGVEWPDHPSGAPSFRLEDITAANGIAHGQAHDALGDVLATINVAKRVKNLQPQLFDYIYSKRRKRAVAEFLDVTNPRPFLHVSGMLARENQYAAIMLPLAQHPSNPNAVICVDICADPDVLKLDADALKDRLFSAADTLPRGTQRPALKLVHVNKCPVVGTPKLVDSKVARRINIDLDECHKNWQKLRSMDIREKLQRVYSRQVFVVKTEAEQRLYDGFIQDDDRPLMATVRAGTEALLTQSSMTFSDPRYTDLLLSYRARYFPSTLTDVEQNQWHEDCLWRLTDTQSGYCTLEQFNAELTQIEAEPTNDPFRPDVVKALREWAVRVANKFALTTDAT